jgi:hypothetical protein
MDEGGDVDDVGVGLHSSAILDDLHVLWRQALNAALQDQDFLDSLLDSVGGEGASKEVRYPPRETLLLIASCLLACRICWTN